MKFHVRGMHTKDNTMIVLHMGRSLESGQTS